MSTSKIMKIIKELEIKPVKAWSSYNNKTGFRIKQRQEIRTLLEIISGNDLVSMLRDVLSESEIDSLADKYLNVRHVKLNF